MTTYAKANRTAQWFSDDYSSAIFKPNRVVWHTTETIGWPGYAGGSMAPNYTVKPDIPNRTVLWRAHFEDQESSRALVNLAGGVETNTFNSIQVEMCGTCNPAWRVSRPEWPGKLAGRDYLFLPEAPDWFLDGIAAFAADMNRRHGIPLQDPGLTWVPYPASANPDRWDRMSFSQWRLFRGHCGHQHVPENKHGDPGSFKMDAVLAKAAAILTPPTPVPPTEPLWEDEEMLSPDAVKQIREVVEDVMKEYDTALYQWTGHPVCYDTRPGQDPTKRVTPSTLLEDLVRNVPPLDPAR